MSTAEYTPDLFEGLADEPPRGVSGGPSFSHPEREREAVWRQGWYWQTSPRRGDFSPYDPDMMDWVRQQLASGPMKYGELLDARRRAGFEHPYEVADPVRAHVRYLVLADEVVEHKHYLGSPDARSPEYRGWVPLLRLAEKPHD